MKKKRRTPQEVLDLHDPEELWWSDNIMHFNFPEAKVTRRPWKKKGVVMGVEYIIRHSWWRREYARSTKFRHTNRITLKP